MRAQKAKRGRAPAINAEDITAAVLRIGTSGPLTMQKVADTLGVDATTVYRHVGSVQALRSIWARASAPSVERWPNPSEETWESWLAAMAQFYRKALTDDPALIEFAQAALDPEFEGLERATRILVDFGFDARAGAFAHGFMINNVIGFVHQQLIADEEEKQGRPIFVGVLRALQAGPERLPTLRQIGLTQEDFDSDTAFERFLGYVIDGIRAQPGTPKESS